MGFSKREANKHAGAIIARMKELQKDEEFRKKCWLELAKFKGTNREYAKFALKQSIKENDKLRKGSTEGKKDSPRS